MNTGFFDSLVYLLEIYHELSLKQLHSLLFILNIESYILDKKPLFKTTFICRDNFIYCCDLVFMTKMANLSSYLTLYDGDIILVHYEDEENPVRYENLLSASVYGNTTGENIARFLQSLYLRPGDITQMEHFTDCFMSLVIYQCPTYSPLSLKKLIQNAGDAFE